VKRGGPKNIVASVQARLVEQSRSSASSINSRSDSAAGRCRRRGRRRATTGNPGLSRPPRPPARQTAGLSARDLHCREDRSDGAARTGKQPVETRTFDGETMRLAVAATFTRRGIEIPGERPLALTGEFADDAQKKVQWAAFVRRARRPELADLSAIIATLDRFLWPVLQAAARGEPWPRTWSIGGPWKEL